MCKQWSIFSSACQIGVLAIKIFVLPLLGYDAESWLTEQLSWKGPLEGILSKPAQSWANFEIILGSSARCWPQTSQLNTELLTSHLHITIKVILKLPLESASYHLPTFISLSRTVLFWVVPYLEQPVSPLQASCWQASLAQEYRTPSVHSYILIWCALKM